ncbi:hypothetical protein ACP4OV_022920 [Aristida adscensionis]
MPSKAISSLGSIILLCTEQSPELRPPMTVIADKLVKLVQSTGLQKTSTAQHLEVDTQDPSFVTTRPYFEPSSTVSQVMLKTNGFVYHYFSPLLIACCAKSLDCMKLLVEAGADVNYKGPSTPSALMMAVDQQLINIVKFLLEAGADPNIRDDSTHECMVFQDLITLTSIMLESDWSVDGIIRTMRDRPFGSQDAVLTEDRAADVRSQGKEAFAKGDYPEAIYFYGRAMAESPHDPTLFANRSLCWLRMRQGELALLDAQQCKRMCPLWSKAWYREGMALNLLKDHKGAVDVFMEALNLDPESDEIKKALSTWQRTA